MDRQIDHFDKYVSDVLEGRIVVGEHVLNAVKRHVGDVQRMKSGDFPYYFDRQIADRAISAFPLLFRHTIGAYADSPFVLSPWQAFIVGCVFGWKCEDGTRRFRRCYVSIGRKNGKSTLAAGISILLGRFDGEQQAQVYIGATKADQAKVIFHEACRMIRKSPHLAKMSDIRVGQINFDATNSYIRPLGSDRAFDGLNPHGIIFDELHAWKEIHRPFYDTLTTGSASRKQPLRFTITTAGDNKSLIWKEENDYACEVAAGRIAEENYFVFVASMDKNDDIFNERNWPKSLPNLGVSVSIDYIREQAREAQSSPQARNRFARYFANVEVTSAEQAIDPALWDACQGELSDWNFADVICGGIDHGGKSDLAANAMVARFVEGEDENGKPDYRYEVRCRCFIDTDTSRDLTQQPWESWVRSEKLFVSSQVSADLRDSLAMEMQQHGFRQIGLDPWNTRQIGEELQAEGFEPVNISQTRANMNEPLTMFMDLIRKGKIRHDGSQPILRWAIGNLVIDRDQNDRWMPSKKQSADKIDPVVAVLMALRLASLAPAKAKGSLFIS